MHRVAPALGLALALLSCTGYAAALSTAEQRIIGAFDARQEAAVSLLSETVDIDSATENHAGVRKVGDTFARELRALGFDTRWVELPAEAGDFLAVGGPPGPGLASIRSARPRPGRLRNRRRTSPQG